MVTIYQIQQGFLRFIENYIACAFDGWQKIVVLSGATLIGNNMHSIIKTYQSHPFISSLCLIDSESGLVNIEQIYNALIPNIQNEKIPISVPYIGVIKLGKDEITILYNCIKGEQ